MAKISDLKFGENFKIEPKFLDLIQNSDTFITENLITIKLKVDKKVAYYIKRREIFPNQKILETLNSGDILLEIKASFEPEILGIISYWIPFVSILEPLYLKEKLLENIKNYIEKEKV